MKSQRFQSTFPARGATRWDAKKYRYMRISIHAPRTGSDASCKSLQSAKTISIHAPRTGSDGRAGGRISHFPQDFNPRSPHGERHWDDISEAYSAYISIHAPRTGSDGMRTQDEIRDTLFQSTLPARGATRKLKAMTRDEFAFQSTLPARGATQIEILPVLSAGHFNPRSPHGERRERIGAGRSTSTFQSTLPARGATYESAMDKLLAKTFQSTLPARGAT